MYILILLFVIAIAETVRVVQTQLPVSKHGHFKQKKMGTEKMIWDLEFKLFKTRELREEIRQQYDFMISRLTSFEKMIAEWPKDKDQNELKRLEDQKVLAQRDADRYAAQIQGLDAEISGMQPTAEKPEGHIGIIEQIESYRELVIMLRDYIRKI